MLKTAMIVLKWSEDEPEIRVSNVEQLDQWLDRLEREFSTKPPIIALIFVHEHEVGIGLGLPRSFVHVEHKSGSGAYYMTVGDLQSDEVLAFYLLDNHHTEISAHNLIPRAEARRVVREFCVSGERSLEVQWEQV